MKGIKLVICNSESTPINQCQDVNIVHFVLHMCSFDVSY